MELPEVNAFSSSEKSQAIEAINRSRNTIEKSPIKKKCLGEKKYLEEKLESDAGFSNKILDLSLSIPDSDVSKHNG